MIVTSGAFTFLLLAASLGNQIIQVGVAYGNFLLATILNVVFA
jgi:hypothetical protein